VVFLWGSPLRGRRGGQAEWPRGRAGRAGVEKREAAPGRRPQAGPVPCCEAPLALAKRGSEASAPNHAGAELVPPFGDSLNGGCQGRRSPEGGNCGGGRAAAPSTRGAKRSDGAPLAAGRTGAGPQRAAERAEQGETRERASRAEQGTPGPEGSAASVAGRGERAGRRAACAERQARPGTRRAGGARPAEVSRARRGEQAGITRVRRAVALGIARTLGWRRPAEEV